MISDQAATAEPAQPRRLGQARLADIIAAQVREQILSGALPPGERLPRQEVLAARLGVSLAITR